MSEWMHQFGASISDNFNHSAPQWCNIDNNSLESVPIHR